MSGFECRPPGDGVSVPKKKSVSSQALAKWALFIFLMGTILDYGGQLYIKRLVYFLMLIITLTHSRPRAILRRCLPDLLVLLVIPVAILLLHLVFDPGEGFGKAAAGLWLCLGAPAYFLCLPLIFLVGVERTAKWLVIAFAIHAILSTLLTLAHAMGVINLLQYSDFMMSHGIGVFSSDSRASDFGGFKIGLPRLGGYQSYPLMFILGLALSPLSSFFLMLAVIATTERGLAIGLVLGFIGMLKPLRAKWLKSKASKIKASRRFISNSIKILLISAIIYFVISYLDQIIALFVFKFKVIGDATDPSTSIRLGHVEGYLEKLQRHPLGLLWGFGPLAGIYNKSLGETIQMTELVVLMYILWYGLIYTIVFYAWAGGSIWGLFHKSNILFDRALAISCGVMVVIGNINPIMQMPIAFILFAMLRARSLELKVQKDLIGYRNV